MGNLKMFAVDLIELVSLAKLKLLQFAFNFYHVADVARPMMAMGWWQIYIIAQA